MSRDAPADATYLVGGETDGSLAVDPPGRATTYVERGGDTSEQPWLRAAFTVGADRGDGRVTATFAATPEAAADHADDLDADGPAHLFVPAGSVDEYGPVEGYDETTTVGPGDEFEVRVTDRGVTAGERRGTGEFEGRER
jgi:hypothetical protein